MDNFSVGAQRSSVFFLMVAQDSTEWMYHYLFNQTFMDRHVILDFYKQ